MSCLDGHRPRSLAAARTWLHGENVVRWTLKATNVGLSTDVATNPETTAPDLLLTDILLPVEGGD